MKITFFLGKGGTGKSTMASIQALNDSERGQTLLVSLDPAHNLSDILGLKLKHRLKKVCKNLMAAEVDEKKMMADYLKDVTLQMKKNYSYHSAFNINGYFDLFRYSPSAEEFALLMAFEQIIQKNEKAYSIIFDMPPTALALKFFQLPAVTLIWIGKLRQLREEISAKKELITKIKFGKKSIETDKVLRRIDTLKSRYEKISDIFQNRNIVTVIPVLNNDSLSRHETTTIIETLKKNNITVQKLILNRIHDGKNPSKTTITLPENMEIISFPESEEPLISLETLKKHTL